MKSYLTVLATILLLTPLALLFGPWLALAHPPLGLSRWQTSAVLTLAAGMLGAGIFRRHSAVGQAFLAGGFLAWFAMGWAGLATAY